MGTQWSRLGRRAQISIASSVALMVVALLVLLLGGSRGTPPVAIGATATSGRASSGERHSPAGTPTTVAADRLHPNPLLTPGATFPGVTSAQVCVRGYSASVRSVSDGTRDQVFAEYGLSSVNRSDYEVDHLISLELGGSNDITNLWPQPLHDPTRDDAVDKDGIENDLHGLVCAGEISLADAQHAIVHWDTVGSR